MVIASSNDGTLLERCLDALVAQADPGSVEIIIVRDAGRFGDVRRAESTEPVQNVQWIEAPPGSTVPLLRGLGIAAARADLVALLEDDCLVAPGWCRAAANSGNRVAAVGGAVEPGPYRRTLDWAIYFCEYGRFMLPVPSAGPAPLPGNNVVYRRWALDDLPETVRTEFREVFVHTAWQLAGVPTRVDGSLVVHNVNTWSLPDVTSDPYHHGRAYAAGRFGARSAPFRTVVALLALALPVVKLLRIVGGTVSRGRLIGPLALAVPWMLVFVTSWSLGEMAGCLAGPGESPARWR